MRSRKSLLSLDPREEGGFFSLRAAETDDQSGRDENGNQEGRVKANTVDIMRTTFTIVLLLTLRRIWIAFVLFI